MPWAAAAPVISSIGGSVLSAVSGKKKSNKASDAAANRPLMLGSNEIFTPGYNLRNDYWARDNTARTTLTRNDTPENRAIDEGLLATLNQVRDAKSLVRPGFGALTQAVTKAIADARAVAGGNLRESLARRRVAGASFGLDAETRLNSEFAKLDSEARSQSFLAEFATTMDLITTEHSMLRQQVDDQIKLVGLASGQGAALQSLSASNSLFERTMAAQAAAGAGQFAGQNTQKIIDALTGADWGTIFGGGAASSGMANASTTAGFSQLLSATSSSGGG